MKRKFKQLHVAIISGIFVLMLVIATVVPASATFTELRVVSWDVMSLTFNHPSGENNGSAGEFTVSLYDDEEEEWGGPQAAFCVDLDTHIGQERYDIESMLQPEPVEIAWLMDTYSPVSSTVSGAALQSAIWEVLYGNDFTLTGPSPGVTDLYTIYMDALDNATIDTNYLLSNYSVVNLNDHQNLLVQNSSSAPVPEPTTMLLLGAGLLGLAGVRKKKIK